MNFIIFIPYLIDVVSSINWLMAFILISGAVLALITAFTWLISDGEVNGFDKLALVHNKFAWIIAFVVLSLLTPAKSTMYQMAALWGGVQIADTEAVKKLAPATFKVLEKMATEYLNENIKTTKKKGE